MKIVSVISKAVTLLEKRHRIFVSQEPIRIRVTVFSCHPVEVAEKKTWRMM